MLRCVFALMRYSSRGKNSEAELTDTINPLTVTESAALSFGLRLRWAQVWWLSAADTAAAALCQSSATGCLTADNISCTPVMSLIFPDLYRIWSLKLERCDLTVCERFLCFWSCHLLCVARKSCLISGPSCIHGTRQSALWNPPPGLLTTPHCRYDTLLSVLVTLHRFPLFIHSSSYVPSIVRFDTWVVIWKYLLQQEEHARERTLS